eukprot:UN06680
MATMRPFQFVRQRACIYPKSLTSSIRKQSTASLYQLEQLELTDRAREYYENGYLIVPQLFDQQELQNIKSEMIEICCGNRGDIEGFQPDKSGTDLQILSRYLAIHFPHKISEKVLNFASSHKGTVQVLKEIISPNVKLIQTMMFMKGPGQPGQNWHQDEYYIPTRDKSLTGCWVAVEDADTENGCLWILPKSHLNGFIYPTKDHGDYYNFDRTPRAIIEHFNEYEYNPIPTEAIPAEL